MPARNLRKLTFHAGIEADGSHPPSAHFATINKNCLHSPAV
jgi:hypothetical protein